MDSLSSDLAVRWKRWVNRFKNLLVATNITDDAMQNAMLLHYAGEEVHTIYDTLPIPDLADGQKSLDVTIEALTSHFAPDTNRE